MTSETERPGKVSYTDRQADRKKELFKVGGGKNGGQNKRGSHFFHFFKLYPLICFKRS